MLETAEIGHLLSVSSRQLVISLSLYIEVPLPRRLLSPHPSKASATFSTKHRRIHFATSPITSQARHPSLTMRARVRLLALLLQLPSFNYPYLHPTLIPAIPLYTQLIRRHLVTYRPKSYRLFSPLVRCLHPILLRLSIQLPPLQLELLLIALPSLHQ